MMSWVLEISRILGCVQPVEGDLGDVLAFFKGNLLVSWEGCPLDKSLWSYQRLGSYFKFRASSLKLSDNSSKIQIRSYLTKK